MVQAHRHGGDVLERDVLVLARLSLSHVRQSLHVQPSCAIVFQCSITRSRFPDHQPGRKGNGAWSFHEVNARSHASVSIRHQHWSVSGICSP